MENLTVIVPFFNGHDVIERLLDSLPEDLPITVVDDHSDVPLQLDNDNVTVIRPMEKGFFSGACNSGIAACDTDVLILNQDVWFENDGWMDVIQEYRDQYAVIGDGVMNHPAWPLGYVQGTFMFIKREAWEKVGEFNVKDYPLWGSTCEWQLRACRMGYSAKPLPDIPGMKHREGDRAGVGPSIRQALRLWPGKRGLFLRTPPAISIVVPCYNYGKHLDDVLHSLLGGPTCLGEWEPQTFQSFEVIIVDDASTDGSQEQAKAWHDRWRGIRSVLLTHNVGTPNTINEGVKRAFGEYIYIISADDMVESWALDKHYRHALANPNAAIYGDLEFFRPGQRLKPFRLPKYDFNKLIYRNQLPACIMYPRRAWIDVGGYPSIMTEGREDWAFAVAIGVEGYCGVKMEGQSGNLIRRDGQNRSLRNQGMYQHFLKQIMSLYPGIYEGERPMGCCGGRSRVNRSVPRQTVPQTAESLAIARQGFRLIEYVGGNAGTGTFFGPVSGRRYKFGGNAKDRVGYVEAVDFQSMLAQMSNKKPVFVAYEPPSVQKVIPDPETIPEKIEVDATVAARKLAEARGIDLADVIGTGKGGRITRGDVEGYDD